MTSDFSDTVDTVCLAARMVLENGGETYRAEETVERMCSGLGIKNVEVIALPTGIMLSVTDGNGSSLSRIVRVHSRSVNLQRLDDCNSVSRSVAKRELNAADARKALEAICTAPVPSLWVSMAGWAFSSAAFVIMLGGQLHEFLFAILIGALIQLGMPQLSRHSIPTLVSGLATGFFATLFALLCSLAVPSLNIEPVIAGTIMPVLPGLATTNAIRDTIKGDLVSGGARITEAALTAAMIAIGICIMLALWGGVFA